MPAGTVFNIANKNCGVIHMARQNPFRELMDQMNTAFEDLYDMSQEAGSAVSGRVPVDIRESDDSYVITADMPGLEKDRIDVRVDGRMLHLSAQDDRAVEEEGHDYVRRERTSRSVSRSIRLPGPVDPDSAEAEYADGVLTVTLEKGGPSGTDVEVA